MTNQPPPKTKPRSPKPPTPPTPPSPSSAPPQNERAVDATYTSSRGAQHGGQRVVLYGKGGVGKTELCSLLDQANLEPFFLDLEDGSRELDVWRTNNITTLEAFRACLHGTEVREAGVIVVDTMTKLEELCKDFVVRTIPKSKGGKADNIEAYLYGEGYRHIYDQILLLMGDFDALARRGKHIVLICHECADNVPNPSGEEFKAFQPLLLENKKAPVRSRVKGWCDHMLYVRFDVHVADGKVSGSGSRSIETNEMPEFWAKTRRLSGSWPYVQGDGRIWEPLLRDNT